MQYAALHLHRREALPPDSIAEVLGSSASYALVLLQRARRRFAAAASTAFLLTQAESIPCPFLAGLRPRDAAGRPKPPLQRLVHYHLAAGCAICSHHLEAAGVDDHLPALVAPVPVPVGLSDRLLQQVKAKAAAREPLPYGPGPVDEDTAGSASQHRHLLSPATGAGKPGRRLLARAAAMAVLLASLVALLLLGPDREERRPVNSRSVQPIVQVKPARPATGSEAVFQIDRSTLPTPAAAPSVAEIPAVPSERGAPGAPSPATPAEPVLRPECSPIARRHI